MRTAIEKTCVFKLQFPCDLHGNDSKSFRSCQHAIPGQFSATYFVNVEPAIVRTTETEAEEECCVENVKSQERGYREISNYAVSLITFTPHEIFFR